MIPGSKKKIFFLNYRDIFKGERNQFEGDFSGQLFEEQNKKDSNKL